MKASIQQKYKIISALWTILGVLFFVGALAAFFMWEHLPQIPRADIAYLGFCIVGAIALIVAAATHCMAKDTQALVEENDERAKMISEKAGSLAFLFQTVLLSCALFLLCFMGYTNAPVMITLISLIAASIFIYFILVFIYHQKM